MLLGAVHDYERADDVTVPLAPGDVLLLYTDGVTDTPGEHGALRRGAPRRRAGRRAARPGRAARGRLAALDGFATRRRARRPRDARLVQARDVPLAAGSDANAGRVALVTGGGTGIGRATALALAGSGARGGVCGRRPAPLEATRARDRGGGRRVPALPADCASRTPSDRSSTPRSSASARSTCSSTTRAASSSRRRRRSPTRAGARSSGSRRRDLAVTRTVATRAMIPGARRAHRLHRLQPAARHAGLRARRRGPRRGREPRVRASRSSGAGTGSARLRRAGLDPHRGPRRLRPGAGRRLGAQRPARPARPPEEVAAR